MAVYTAAEINYIEVLPLHSDENQGQQKRKLSRTYEEHSFNNPRKGHPKITVMPNERSIYSSEADAEDQRRMVSKRKSVNESQPKPNFVKKVKESQPKPNFVKREKKKFSGIYQEHSSNKTHKRHPKVKESKRKPNFVKKEKKKFSGIYQEHSSNKTHKRHPKKPIIITDTRRRSFRREQYKEDHRCMVTADPQYQEKKVKPKRNFLKKTWQNGDATFEKKNTSIYMTTGKNRDTSEDSGEDHRCMVTAVPSYKEKEVQPKRDFIKNNTSIDMTTGKNRDTSEDSGEDYRLIVSNKEPNTSIDMTTEKSRDTSEDSGEVYRLMVSNKGPENEVQPKRNIVKKNTSYNLTTVKGRDTSEDIAEDYRHTVSNKGLKMSRPTKRRLDTSEYDAEDYSHMVSNKGPIIYMPTERSMDTSEDDAEDDRRITTQNPGFEKIIFMTTERSMDTSEDDAEDDRRMISKAPVYARNTGLLSSVSKDNKRKTGLLSSVSSDHTEIQGHPCLKGQLSYYKTFYGYRVTKAVDGEKITPGLRVVLPDYAVGDDNKEYAWNLGTICDIDKAGQVFVKWDVLDKKELKTFKKRDNNQYTLLLYDNTKAGVEHKDFGCDICNTDPIQGMRWVCSVCEDCNLCTTCYMGDKHRLEHAFIRVISPNSKGVEMPIRSKGKKIQENVRDRSTEMYNLATGSAKRKTAVSYYPVHLPVLGQCSEGYFNVWIDDYSNELPGKRINEHIRVYVLRTEHIENPHREMRLQPYLYLIFANSEGDQLSLMKEVSTLAEKTKLPCHVMGQKILFHSGSTSAVCIHYRTDKDTIKELIAIGFRKFTRGDIGEDKKDNDEITYFIRMAEYVIGNAVLPVIISIQNGGKKPAVRQKATDSGIPIIRLEKNTPKAYVIWSTNDPHSVYQVHNKTPWRIKQKDKQFEPSDDIALLSDIDWDIENIVCSSIIGVHMENPQLDMLKDSCVTHDYLTVCATYLLKKGEWTIPKKHFTKTIGQLSLEYIFQKVISPKLMMELWKSFSNMGYKLPHYSEIADETESKVVNTNTDDPDKDSMGKQESSFEYNLKRKGRNFKITKWNSDSYGFVFFALLQKGYWKGATQLVEMGYIGIHDILFGCVLLEEKDNDWKTTQLLKEEIQRSKNVYTEIALRITNSIYDVDKTTDDIESDTPYEQRDGYTEEHSIQKNAKEREFGEKINHAGRLLLNHGYLRDAIKTKNNAYLENDTVKKIVNTKWYGIEKIDFHTIGSFVLLTAVHIIVLPLLMINMEAGPLHRLYKMYSLPFLKVIIHMVGLLALIITYAYMLLFDYSDDGISYTDYILIAWISSLFVDEIQQVAIAFIRDKLKSYRKDWWNILDWVLIVAYTSGMILRYGEGSRFQIASKCVLVAVFMLLCIRILKLCCMTEFLGPKLVIIRKMIKETIAFMIIMTVIMVWYSVSFYSLLYPNSEFSWTQIEKVFSNGYWMLFGELNLDGDTLTVPECTFNKTVYKSGALQRCPTQLGLYLTPYLKALYGLIAVVLLLNLLIAMYSDTFNAVQQKSDFYWKQIQTDFLEEYSIKTIFPIHLQLLALPGTICALIYLLYLHCRGTPTENQHINHRPMFVRVFLYDTNYDLKLPSTREAEVNAAVESYGKTDFTDVDFITNSKIIDDSNDKQNPELMDRIKNVEHSINLIQQTLEQLLNYQKKEEQEVEEEEEHEQEQEQDEEQEELGEYQEKEEGKEDVNNEEEKVKEI